MKALLYILILFTFCFLSGCTSKSTTPFILHETPQTYILQNEDPFSIMPEITLYANGNAQLSQPPISCLALFNNTAYYVIDGNELTVSSAENGTVIFEVSDNGNTLTLKSSILCFTKVDSVYQYCANSAYTPKKWLDYYNDEELPYEKTNELTLPAFPDVTFTWTSEKVTAGDQELFEGMPIWNVYLTDLTNDGKPEFCATISFGSGIVDTHVLVYDYTADKVYQLADRMHYDYYLSMEDGQIIVTQTDYTDGKPLASAKLQIIGGEILRFGQSNGDTP